MFLTLALSSTAGHTSDDPKRFEGVAHMPDQRLGWRVLVVAPHPDDESIGCGGAICLHHDRGDRVVVVFLTSGERGLPETPPEQVRAIREVESEGAAEVLRVDRIEFLRLPDSELSAHIGTAARSLRRVLQAFKPDRIYLPHPDEIHPDHRATVPIVRAALAPLPRRSGLPELLGYEIWTALAQVDSAEDISGVMGRKLQAIRRYQSQLACYRYDHAARALARYRGIMHAQVRYAEAYRNLHPSETVGLWRDCRRIAGGTRYVRAVRRVAGWFGTEGRGRLAPSVEERG
jgi:LmbE family N-acetylglucosaminyl deacetylase